MGLLEEKPQKIKNIDYGEGSASNPGFPKMPKWFKDKRDWFKIFNKLSDLGLSDKQIKKIQGENWFNFFKRTNSFR